jgi:hypothetical protein
MLSQHWKQVRYQADQEAGVAAEKELHERRWLRLTQTWSGMYEIEGLLDPVTGAALSTALRAIMGRKAADDDRTPGQRRVASCWNPPEAGPASPLRPPSAARARPSSARRHADAP